MAFSLSPSLNVNKVHITVVISHPAKGIFAQNKHNPPGPDRRQTRLKTLPSRTTLRAVITNCLYLFLDLHSDSDVTQVPVLCRIFALVRIQTLIP